MTKEEAKEFAKSIGATFKQTSALSKVGIEELFNELGKRFLDSDYSNNRINSGSSSTDDGLYAPNLNLINRENSNFDTNFYFNVIYIFAKVLTI